LSPLDKFIKKNQTVIAMMRGVVDDALEVIEFGLEMTKIALNILVEVDLAENCLIQICSEFGCRHKTANLSKNRKVSN
jgi:hypothetical protein